MVENHPPSHHSMEPLYYVGVGASAGGLEALQDFFQSMPSDTGMAFVVIQHLSPDYRSMMDELLARYTNMQIHIAQDGMFVERNVIYLIPPRSNLKIFHGKLFLEDQLNRKSLNLPIDVFFRSLATDQGQRSIAVILSGTGSDGTLGVRAVKEAGGIILVQDEKTAKFDGMPRSSISTGLVDYILPPANMAEEMLNYIKHPFIRKTKTLEKDLPQNLDTLTKINLILRDHIGIDFSYYKENTVIRRLERRVSINRHNSLEEYLAFLLESDKEKEILHRELLIGVTRFFRDSEAFASLRQQVLPKLDWKKNTIRLWSAGCSTGEEVYALTMCCLEEMEKQRSHCDLKVFATDIDRNALNVASQGFYPESIVADIEPVLLTKYFNRLENGFQVKENVRKAVVFASHNLLKDPPFSRLDLMVCRNLFIYLKPDMQQRILNMFYYSLKPNGFLFMGSSESLGEMSEGFRTVDSKWKIYQYQQGFHPPVAKNLSLLPQLTTKNENLFANNRNTGDSLRQSKLLERALESSMPPSVIVDRNDHIIQVINDMNPFFQIKAGQFSNNLLKILPSELALYTNGVLRQLRGGQEQLTIDTLADVVIEGRILKVDQISYYLLTFRSGTKIAQPEGHDKPTSAEFNSQMSQHIQNLEKELQVSRENLQATVEELETSNEELQSSNEELIASNEELQSTNEELQSVNEELYTVNSEFQAKIDELTQSNNDLINLLNNTAIGAIYLDRHLCIRKITPITSKITHLRETDIGRPIAHVATIEFYPDLMEDIKQVQKTLQNTDREVVDQHERTWFVRIRPYRTSYNAVEGILITFIDISRLKHFEGEVANTSRLLETVLEYSPLAKTMVDAKGQIIYANKKAEELLGITRRQIRHRTYDASAWKITDLNGNPIPQNELPFALLKSTNKPVKAFKHYIDIPGSGRRLLSISGVPVLRQDGTFDGGVFALEQEEGGALQDDSPKEPQPLADTDHKNSAR